MRATWKHIAAAVLAAFALSTAGAAGDDPGDDPDPEVRTLWEEGRALERREALVAASLAYERIAERLPESASIRWRIARNYWRAGERLAVDDKERRLEHFRTAERWADDALALDPECGECVMWKLSSLGRIATTRGVVESARTAPQIQRLIERGIELRPTHSDGPDNHTLGNLYYAGAAFHRILPDWWWLPMVIGVRGDNHKALEYIQRAIEISAQRVDYQVELGAVLLCIGSEEGDAARVEEGTRTLRHALELEKILPTDESDRAHALVLMDQPERACGYSRDGWIELDEAETRRNRTKRS